MSKLNFFFAPTSITIYDGNNNRLVIHKKSFGNFKKAEIVPDISAQDTRARNNAVELANMLVKVLNTKKPKDSFQKGFGKLQKMLTGIEVTSFEILKNRVEAILFPAAATEQKAEPVKAETEVLETV